MVLADLGAFLREPTWEAEEELWMELFNDVKWHVSPGGQYITSRPGWFRVMFTAQVYHTDAELAKPFEELGRRLIDWQKTRKTKTEQIKKIKAVNSSGSTDSLKRSTHVKKRDLKNNKKSVPKKSASNPTT